MDYGRTRVTNPMTVFSLYRQRCLEKVMLLKNMNVRKQPVISWQGFTRLFSFGLMIVLPQSGQMLLYELKKISL